MLNFTYFLHKVRTLQLADLVMPDGTQCPVCPEVYLTKIDSVVSEWGFEVHVYKLYFLLVTDSVLYRLI